ncbi:helix-turn-helix domain-containing protein [Yersinia pseudotuberculosis]|uniref:helix-turn-helix domain-containing protein n=1 Tax=Yersinia pseudotuberculosis TaxID=633 RepID=UPI000710105E|nr:helix-turn-helix transcriptional regulator [Yersinia pseudotuberculosis]AXY35187.1 XRE family transcriptional regulator [Yersinia pseudotuberculosis]AYX10849.1 XRE family transcriptional regulator [Yersinia pseudotuberculosis]MBO1591891.1 helix-turn-helix domain-containing protein [Yersinia pseudotuberculosis]PEI14755.1 XRE family transcriptional regulator [Yersinia pseudotuberculosis]
MSINIWHKKPNVKPSSVFCANQFNPIDFGANPLMTSSYKEKTDIEANKPEQFIPDPRIIRFGERLRQAMKGESNNSFAKRCGMSERVIRNYLDGSTYPSIDRLAILAKASGVSLEWLVSGQLDSDKNAYSDINAEKEEATPPSEKQLQAWVEILERMKPEERETVIDKVFRQGISVLLAAVQPSTQTAQPKLPLPNDLPERLGISHDAMAMGMLYDSLPNKDRQKILADIAMQQLLASGHEASDKQAG